MRYDEILFLCKFLNVLFEFLKTSLRAQLKPGKSVVAECANISLNSVSIAWK